MLSPYPLPLYPSGLRSLSCWIKDRSPAFSSLLAIHFFFLPSPTRLGPVKKDFLRRCPRYISDQQHSTERRILLGVAR